MPRRKSRSTRKRPTKRTYRRKRNPNRKHRMVMNYADRPENQTLTRFYKNLPFPTIKRVKLTYQGYCTLNSVSLSSTYGASQTIGLNTLNDPDLSGVGHQPYGYDQLASATGPYNRYKVNAAKVTLVFFGLNGGDDPGNLQQTMGGCVLENPTQGAYDIAGKTIEQIGEQNMSQIVRLNNTGSSHGQISFYVPMYKAFNWSKKDYAREQANTTGAYNSDPASLVRLKCAIACLGAPTSQIGCYMTYRVTYYCEMYSRQILAQS